MAYCDQCAFVHSQVMYLTDYVSTPVGFPTHLVMASASSLAHALNVVLASGRPWPGFYSQQGALEAQMLMMQPWQLLTSGPKAAKVTLGSISAMYQAHCPNEQEQVPVPQPPVSPTFDELTVPDAETVALVTRNRVEGIIEAQYADAGFSKGVKTRTYNLFLQGQDQKALAYLHRQAQKNMSQKRKRAEKAAAKAKTP
jgi:hypothetical protein